MTNSGAQSALMAPILAALPCCTGFSFSEFRFLTGRICLTFELSLQKSSPLDFGVNADPELSIGSASDTHTYTEADESKT